MKPIFTINLEPDTELFLNDLNCFYANAITTDDETQLIDNVSLDGQLKNSIVSIEWRNLNVSTYSPNSLFKSSTKQMQIIRNVSGRVISGHLLAIMGASGAGKTTLMNVLTGRNLQNLKVGGEVLLNDQRVTTDKIASCSAYVQQDDMFIGVLTVREHLLFQAHLRINALSENNIVEKVNKVIVELGLKKIENVRIGSQGMDKSISGGEMKRLAFASEILTEPSILFCDEPTTGLDSFMARSVVKVLKSISSSNRIVLATIHQPSSEIFKMFDEILLLSQGRVAFMGKSSDALKFFSEIGLHCPINYNPADFYIQQLAINLEEEDERIHKIEKICKKFAFSKYEKMLSKSNNPVIGSRFRFKVNGNFKYKKDLKTQFKWVLWRSWLTNTREPLITYIRIGQIIFTALLLGVIYGNQENNQESIMNINGALFILLINMTSTNFFLVVNTFCPEIPIFLREHDNGIYSSTIYFLAKTIAEFPFFLLLPILFSSITFCMIGLYNDFATFLGSAFVLTLVANVASGFGYFFSCISKNVTMGLTIAPPFMIPLMIFGGLFLNNNSIPVYLEWIKYLSWFYYGNEILVINQWEKTTNITCDLPNLSTQSLASGCIYNGKGVIRKLNFYEDNVIRNVFALIALIIASRLMALFSLKVRIKLSR